MSRNCEPTQARKTRSAEKYFEGMFLADLGHKMVSTGYFPDFPSVLSI